MTARVERPNLDYLKQAAPAWRQPTLLRSQLLSVIAYALQLEQGAAGARKNLAELEWSGDMFNDGGYCFHCGNLKTEGHMPGCGLAALGALLAAAS